MSHKYFKDFLARPEPDQSFRSGKELFCQFTGTMVRLIKGTEECCCITCQLTWTPGEVVVRAKVNTGNILPPPLLGQTIAVIMNMNNTFLFISPVSLLLSLKLYYFISCSLYILCPCFGMFRGGLASVYYE